MAEWQYALGCNPSYGGSIPSRVSKYEDELMNDKNQRHLDLGWWLIESKLLYYHPDLFSEKMVSTYGAPDWLYDKREKEYVKLCEELDHYNSVQSMVGVDLDRPSVQLAITALERIDDELRRGFKPVTILRDKLDNDV